MGTLHTLLMRVPKGAASLENSSDEFLKKLNLSILRDSAIPLLGMFLRK